MQTVLEADPSCLMRQVTLPPQAESAGAARRAVRRTLAYWGLGEVTDDAVLLVSELVANAVCHARHDHRRPGRRPGLVLSLTCAGSSLRIEVRDTDPRPPQPARAGLAGRVRLRVRHRGHHGQQLGRVPGRTRQSGLG